MTRSNYQLHRYIVCLGAVLLASCASRNDVAPTLLFAALVPFLHNEPPDPHCDHQPRTPPLPARVSANHIAILDINALPWLQNPESASGEGNYEFLTIGSALSRSKYEFLELKAPSYFTPVYVRSAYRELAQDHKANYLRVRFRPVGDPGCSAYRKFIQEYDTPQNQIRRTMRGLGVADDTCIAVEAASEAISQYGLTETDRADNLRSRHEWIDLRSGKVFAQYYRNSYSGSGCPAPELRRQFMELVSPVISAETPQATDNNPQSP